MALVTDNPQSADALNADANRTRLREVALQHAITHSESYHTADELVGDAEKYFAFLTDAAKDETETNASFDLPEGI